MDNDTRSWLVGVPFETNAAGPPRERLSLSPGQKRELASVTGLVMASTVFFLTPLLISSEDAPAGISPLVHASVPVVAPVLAPELDAPTIGAPAALPSPRPAHSTPRVRTTPLRPMRAMVLPSADAHQVISAPAAVRGPDKRKGITGALKRALVGNGRHRVQPFPTPASTNSRQSSVISRQS